MKKQKFDEIVSSASQSNESSMSDSEIQEVNSTQLMEEMKVTEEVLENKMDAAQKEERKEWENMKDVSDSGINFSGAKCLSELIKNSPNYLMSKIAGHALLFVSGFEYLSQCSDPTLPLGLSLAFYAVSAQQYGFTETLEAAKENSIMLAESSYAFFNSTKEKFNYVIVSPPRSFPPVPVLPACSRS